MFSHIVDDEIILRPVEPHYAEQMFALTDANRDHLREWLRWLDATTSKKDILAFIESAQQQYAANKGVNAAIWYFDQMGRVIGFHTIDWQNGSTSLGYWLGRSFQERRIMTRSCRAFVAYALGELRLNRIEIRCALEDSPRRAKPERLGFKNEGTVRAAECLYGRFVDNIVYGMLADDWTVEAPST